LLLACVGLYGVVAQDVVRRRTEIGLRVALGAQPAEVLRMVLADTATMFVAGLAVGIPSAFAASKLISSQLFGLRAADLTSFAVAIIVISVVTACAAFIPARRASRVDPMIALRHE
jgi:ABC-type antimicrobial peptide transport system permease subunit